MKKSEIKLLLWSANSNLEVTRAISLIRAARRSLDDLESFLRDEESTTFNTGCDGVRFMAEAHTLCADVSQQRRITKAIEVLSDE